MPDPLFRRLVRFSCDVDRPPRLARALLGRQGDGQDTPPADAVEAVVAPGFRAVEPPQWRFLRIHARDDAPEPPLCSVRDGRTGVTYPYWASGASSAAVRAMRADEGVDSPDAGLVAAGILEPAGWTARRVARWDAELPALVAALERDGVTEVSLPLWPLHVAALRDYFSGLIAAGELALGDGQSDRRYVAYNDPVASYFHSELTGLVSSLAGCSVRPSYSYFIAYEHEGALARHTDREQCDYTLNVLLDYQPEPEERSPWPLELFPTSGTVRLRQRIGDAVLIRGCTVPHSRSQQPPDSRSMSVLFHYVGPDFAGSTI